MWTQGPATFHLSPSEALPEPLALHLELAALAELRAPGSGRARFRAGGPGQAEQEVGYAARLETQEDLGRYADPQDPAVPDPAQGEVWVLAGVHTEPRYVLVEGPVLRARLEAALASDPRAQEPFAREKGAAPYLQAAARYDGVGTLTELADACETCGRRAGFTGRVEARGREVYALLHCPQCRVDFPVWSRAAEPVLAAWQAASMDAPDRLRLREALAALRSGAGTEALILDAEYGRRLPWIGIDEARVGPDLAERWLRLVLDSGHWVPVPSMRGRWTEALAFVGATGAGASVIAARLGQAQDDDLESAFKDLALRPCPAAASLLPVADLLDEARFPTAGPAARRIPELGRPRGRA